MRINCFVLYLLAFGALLTPVVRGRDLSGQWQGTLPTLEGERRIVLRIKPADKGTLAASLVFIDQSPEDAPANASLEGSTFKLSFDGAPDRYEGTVGDDGTIIRGKWYSGRHPGTIYPFDLHLTTPATAWPLDSSPHKIEFVSVDKDVKLEVLDWGGTGRPLMFLAGLGNDAHVFDKFAPKFTSTNHVYGITRRGYGASSKPEPSNNNYSADRLGDDVLVVIDALKLDRPVLAGHSIAGEELSSIGTRHPEKVAGLIYLDAAYERAFYDPERGDLSIDSHEIEKKLTRLDSLQTSLHDSKLLIQELLDTDLPQLAKSLGEERNLLSSRPEDTPATRPDAKFAQAIITGAQRFTAIKCPALAIYAVAPPSDPAKADPEAPTDKERAASAAQAQAFEKGVPSARAVRILNADHYVFLSNEAEVLQAMNDFLAKLP